MMRARPLPTYRPGVAVRIRRSRRVVTLDYCIGDGWWKCSDGLAYHRSKLILTDVNVSRETSFSR
jgi:hypothetical protein